MYDLNIASNYWSKERLENASSPIEAVAGLNRPYYINNGYTNWETRILENILKKHSTKRVLDLACGIGRFTKILAKNNQIEKLYAVDFAPGMLEICQNNLKDIDTRDKIEFICADSTSIPLPKKSLDTIICLGLLEHLPHEWQLQTLEKIYDLLVPEGILILEINNEKSIFLEKNKDNKFRSSLQHNNGYLCNLIKKKEILEKISGLGLEILGKYSNPFFSLTSHWLRELINCKEKNLDDLGAKWIELAEYLDKNVSDVEEKNLNMLSDQFIFEIVKK